MINFRMLKVSDFQIWGSVIFLIILGFLAIFSTTFRLQVRNGGDPFTFINRQFVSLLIGLIAMVAFTYLDYKHLKKAAPFLYLITIIFLLAVLFSGSSAQGAQRWFQLGPFSFQPSEISKLSLIIALSAFFTRRKKITNFTDVLQLLLIIGIPFLLIFKQPDLGTALVFFAILIGMLAISEASPRLLIILSTPLLSLLLRPILFLWLIYLLALALYLFLSRASFFDWLYIFGTNVLVGIALPYLWGALKLYQRQRIIAFLDPSADPFGAGYHTLQSKIAIGGGGLIGKGFLQGTQTQLQFIPEQHSDFIFSAIGEEFGFVGALITLGLFAVLIWKALSISLKTQNNFGSLLAAGISVMLIFHLFANVGMAIGILPVVGIPLPLVSYGGSSLLINLAAIGILQSITMREHKILF